MFFLRLCSLCTLFVSVIAEQLQAPIILRESSDNDVPLGSRKVFTCNAIGYPPPAYIWLREWKNLTANYSTLSYFEIPSAKKEDQGSYRCLAKNDVGIVASKAARLTVWYFDGFLVDQTDQFISVHESDAAVLRLPPISSSPEPSVQWFMKTSSLSRDQTRIMINEKYFITADHHLVILNVEYQDEKIYYAMVDNIFVGGTKQSVDYRLNVNRRSSAFSTNVPELIVRPVDQSATIGDAIKSFECLANAPYPIETVWQKNSVLIDSNNARFHIGPYNRTLEVRGITGDDAGIYSCHVRLRHSDLYVNASARLIVRGVPMITTNFPLIQHVDLQEKITFTCDGTPISNDVNVTWYKNAVPLVNQSTRLQLIGHQLIIEAVEWDDQGMYQCFLTNDVGEDTRSTWLKIKSEAPTVSTSKDMVVFNGTDVQLTCTVSGSPIPNITWTRIDSDRNMRERYYVDTRTGILSISNTIRNDSGVYECQAENILGTATARTSLLVRRRTKITSLPTSLKIVKAQSLKLVCQVFSEQDVITRIYWYFNQNQSLSPKKFFNESTILIDTPQNQDTGNYTCVVESDAGNDSRTTEVTIIELPWPPTFVRASLINDTVTKSVAVNLTWIPNFDGNIPLERYTIQIKENRSPDPLASLGNIDDIGWQTKEEVVVEKHQMKTWTLLRSLRPYTTYRFRVSAWNQLGEGQVSDPSNSLTLPEEIPSGTVKSLTAIPRDSTSVVVEFSKPLESTVNGQLIGYDINYALNYPNPHWKSVRVNASVQTFILKDLMTWESYLISVSVVNNVGVGPASEIVKVRTLEGVPSRAPTLLQYEPINSTAVSLTWQGPTAAYINGILNSFKIELFDWSRNSTVYQEQQAKPIERYQLVIGQLKKYTNYSIRISCATKIGSGPWSTPPVYIQTLEDVPDQVENLTFSNVYDTSLDIIWQKPIESNGHLIAYELEWYPLNQSTSTDRSTIEIEPHSTTYTIQNLSATTWYTISVRAKTRIGYGPKRSASIESGYPPEMPSPPTNLEVISVEKRTAIVRFSPGYTGKTNILRYVVQIQMRSNNSQWETIESSSIDQSILTVRDLQPNQSYRLRMAAVNIKGTSNASVPTEFFRTKPDVPSQVPPVLIAQAWNASAIRVRWMPIPSTSWNTDQEIGYLLSINDSTIGEVKIEDPLADEYTFADLSSPNTPFHIRLRTYNRIGLNDLFVETVEKTFESIPRRAVANLRLQSNNGSSAWISWQTVSPADQGGFITHYRIQLVSSSRSSTEMFDHSDNRTSIDYLLHPLDGYTNYSCSISACTSSGCSAFSEPIHFLTDETVPSKPTEVFFPEVDHWSARMVWQPPMKRNGILLGYQLVYWRSDDEQTKVIVNNLTETTTTYLADNLEKTTPYTFILCAKTRLGCGEPSIHRLLTMEKRDRPAPPYPPNIIESSINTTSLILSWRKDSDFNYAPIRYTLIEYEEEGMSLWKPYPTTEKPDGQVTTMFIQNLKPNTKYRFRLASQNDMGISDFSRPTNFVRTKETAPTVQPEIRALSTDQPCQLDIHFKDFGPMDNQTRLTILIKPVAADQPFEKTFHPITEQRSVHLNNLCSHSHQHTAHVLFACLSNHIGEGPLSFAQYFHIQLPAPTDQSIRSLTVTVMSSTELSVQWTNDPISDTMAYRIRWQTTNTSEEHQRTLIVTSNQTSVILDRLTPFTMYQVKIQIFNIDGDGPIRESEVIRTDEDAPGPIEELMFSYVTFTSLQLDWRQPRSLNGILRSYDLTYDNRLSFSSSLNTSSTRVKTIKQRLSPSNTSLRIDELDPYQVYEFSLCPCTIRCGPCVQKSIQTGPQPHSPPAPSDIRVNKQQDLQWKSSIRAEYYLIEYSLDQGETWKYLARVSQSSYTFQSNLFPINQSMEISIRLFAVNRLGISQSSEIFRYQYTPSSSSFLFTLKLPWTLPNFLRTNPFFFYVLLGMILLLLMFVCVIITCCCCRMKLNKSKLLHSTNTLASNLNTAESKQSLYTASTLLTPTARQLTMQRNRDSLALSDLLYNNFSSRSPPRPIPTPIVYDDLTSTKSLLGNNTNATAAAPAAPSTTDDNQSNTDYPWYHSLPQQLYTYMSNNHLTSRIHEENETDETDLAVAFNGAILMNNVPRSRAAVNGCSSFAL